MRYSLFVYIDQMIDSIKEGAMYIGKSNNISMCTNLAIECSEALEAIEKKLIENNGKIKDERVLKQLSLCKEQINRIYHLLQNNNDYHGCALIFEDTVSKLKDMYRKGIDIIYHIVFFAELGQKWDSMSSVYNAFKKRKDCEVKVVLTPIFRAVQSDEKVKKDVIYEDYLTPMGISHIPYFQYDISKELPDMAFISNPYESVTISKFWPENIAKFTRLVYLPYYTDMIINSESSQVHCDFPVAKYAWKIIAQSDKVKDIHKKLAPKRGENVLVTGLPKWDDIYSLNIDPPELDPSWKIKLKGRKVFLWNSHYNIGSDKSALLEFGKSIIDFFSKRKDIALVWRPHPMTETIFKLYLPQYKAFWEDLKDTVSKSDNMLLDVNPSYQMAFQYSDALISDWSSLLAQYMMTKKPILWLRKEKANEDYLSNSRFLVRVDCLEQAISSEEIYEFINRIIKGIDMNRDSRLLVLQEDLPNFDGNIGERVCSLLLKELNEEFTLN